VRYLLALLLAAGLAACSTPAATPPPGGEPQPEPALQGRDAAEAAAKSLDAYRKLVSANDFAALGFESLDEVAQAQLGRSFPVTLVPLDRLQRFERGTNPEDLFVDAGRVIYEVRVGDAVRSSLDVGRIGDLWQGESFGSPGLVRPLSALRQADNDFVVWVAALNVYFEATRALEQLVLTPVFDYPDLGLSAGKAMPAADALGSLVDAAKAVTGEFPN
jgi:hypothetical protein